MQISRKQLSILFSNTFENLDKGYKRNEKVLKLCIFKDMSLKKTTDML